MCPMCLTTTALIVAGTTSGAGVLGYATAKVLGLRRQRRKPRELQLKSKE